MDNLLQMTTDWKVKDQSQELQMGLNSDKFNS